MATDLDSYFPFDAGAGANNQESRWRDLHRYVNGTTGGRNGIIRAAFQGQVFADSTGLQVKIPPTEVWIEGHYGLSSTTKTVAVSPNSTGATRVDRVVARANYVTNKLEYDVVAGASPTVPPARVQNSNQFEISLATVAVPNGASFIAAGAVFDARDFVDGNPNVITRATADTTVNNSTTLVDATNFSVVASADALYLFESFIDYSAATAADLRLRVAIPTGGSGQLANTSLDFNSVTITAGIVDMASNAANTDFAFAGIGVGNRVSATTTGWLQMPAAAPTSPTAMMVKIQMAQWTANVSDAKVYANSWFKLTRV